MLFDLYVINLYYRCTNSKTCSMKCYKKKLFNNNKVKLYKQQTCFLSDLGLLLMYTHEIQTYKSHKCFIKY